MSTNPVIVDRVRATLESDSRISHPAEVAVSERAGTVMLRGTVPSFPQRRAAIQAARSVSGVRHVTHELVVDPRYRWDDRELRGVALQSLMTDGVVPADRVDVTVADGWLTLKGEVQHQYESDAAFESVRRVPGVGGITNKIMVITAGIDG